MPKATLTFSLPEEREDYELCVNAGKIVCAVSDFKNWLRGCVKYGEEVPDAYKIYDELCTTLSDIGIEI